jgi:hypothetical protein
MRSLPSRVRSTCSTVATWISPGYYSKQGYPTALRRVVLRDEDGKRITFLTNNTSLAPAAVGELYRLRWQDRRGDLRADRHRQEARDAGA